MSMRSRQSLKSASRTFKRNNGSHKLNAARGLRAGFRL